MDEAEDSLLPENYGRTRTRKAHPHNCSKNRHKLV